MAFERLRRLLPDVAERGTERAVDSVRHGGDDRVDADPDLDRIREDSPDGGRGRSDPDGRRRSRPGSRRP